MTSTQPTSSSGGGFLSGGWGNSSLSRTLARRSPFGVAQGVAVPPPANASGTNGNAANNAANGGGGAEGETSADGKRQTLFGPMIGGGAEEDDVGGQAGGGSAFGGEDEGGKRETVSVETVKGWIERSKNGENPHPTTTLQSNVNLKRPTLSFTPIALPIGSSSSTNLYNIKFTYDCSTPTVLLSLRLHLPSPTSSNPHATTSETIWAGTLPGGFGRSWSLPQDAQLDLAAIERSLNNTNSKREEYSFDDKRTSSYSATGATTAPVLENQPTTQQTRGGGGLFGMRRGRPTQDDVEAQNTMAMQTIDLNAGASKKGEEGAKAGEPKKMVRLVIRLESRGANGIALSSLNAQQTHVELVRSTAGSSTPNNEQSDPAYDPEGASAQFVLGGDEDGTSTPPAATNGPKRTSWSGKVIRREALIGSHVFHLREIYGLTSSTSNNTASAEDNTTNTYPPQANDDPYASTPNECIVCLVSPRDVVLLPCRHLVVCKECAVGMVEFGAGGKVNRREDGGEIGGPSEATTAGEPSDTGAGGAAGGTTDGTVPVPAPAPVAPAPSRRKKKAKGWFCPVCRQPYTSMLRIALPSTKPGLETTLASHTHAHNVSTHSLPRDIKSGTANPAATDFAGANASSVSVHSVRGDEIPDRAPSPVPTLPGRAESILYPRSEDGEESEEEEVQQVEARRSIGGGGGQDGVVGERPQFVLGPEVDLAGNGGGEGRRRDVEARV